MHIENSRIDMKFQNKKILTQRYQEGLTKESPLIAEGAVPASDLFKQWAEISGQGGYDEASGVKE